MKYFISTYHSIRKKLYNILQIPNFKNFEFFEIIEEKNQNFKNLLTPVCAGGSIKEWVCSVSRVKDGDNWVWVPGLIFSRLIVRKWWNCILIDYVPSHQGRAAIHIPECSLGQ